MAFRDERGRITIDEDAAASDVSKIGGARDRLEESRKALKALISNAQTCSGDTAEAISQRGNDLLYEINRLDEKLEETQMYINKVVRIYQIKDRELKALMAAKSVK